MIERFDHLVIGVRDLDAAARAYRDGLGFEVTPPGRHTGRGTHNVLARFGLDYLELISVYDAAEAERAGRGTLADFLRRRAGGPVAYALATTDIDADAGRLRAAGLDCTGPFAMERARADGSKISWRLLVPSGEQYRRPWPFLIQWDQPDDARLVAEVVGRHPNGARAVREVAVVVADLNQAVDLYGRQLGLALADRGVIPELGAERAIFSLGRFRIALLSPTGAGPVAEALQAAGEGPFHAVLAVADLQASRRDLEARGATLAEAPDVPDGQLIDPDRAIGARLILVSDA